MTIRKARDLIRGDVFRLHLYGEVLSATPVADGKRIKVKLAVENQGQRRNHGTLSGSDKPNGLEFLDADARVYLSAGAGVSSL